MFTYENVKNSLKLFRALTSLDPAEFEVILIWVCFKCFRIAARQPIRVIEIQANSGWERAMYTNGRDVGVGGSADKHPNPHFLRWLASGVTALRHSESSAFQKARSDP